VSTERSATREGAHPSQPSPMALPRRPFPVRPAGQVLRPRAWSKGSARAEECCTPSARTPWTPPHGGSPTCQPRGTAGSTLSSEQPRQRSATDVGRIAASTTLAGGCASPWPTCGRHRTPARRSPASRTATGHLAGRLGQGFRSTVSLWRSSGRRSATASTLRRSTTPWATPCWLRRSARPDSLPGVGPRPGRELPRVGRAGPPPGPGCDARDAHRAKYRRLLSGDR